MIRFISFSERDFRYVSLAFLKATIVAVSPAFGTGDVDRLMGVRARILGEGARLTRGAGSHDDERDAIARRQRATIEDDQGIGVTELRKYLGSTYLASAFFSLPQSSFPARPSPQQRHPRRSKAPYLELAGQQERICFPVRNISLHTCPPIYVRERY